jgi:hypothetical protein
MYVYGVHIFTPKRSAKPKIIPPFLLLAAIKTLFHYGGADYPNSVTCNTFLAVKLIYCEKWGDITFTTLTLRPIINS